MANEFDQTTFDVNTNSLFERPSSELSDYFPFHFDSIEKHLKITSFESGLSQNYWKRVIESDRI